MSPVAPSYRITTEKSSFKQFLFEVPMMAFCNGVKCRLLMVFDSAPSFPFGPKMFLHSFQYPECTHCFQHNQTIIAPTLCNSSTPLNHPSILHSLLLYFPYAQTHLFSLYLFSSFQSNVPRALSFH